MLGPAMLPQLEQNFICALPAAGAAAFAGAAGLATAKVVLGAEDAAATDAFAGAADAGLAPNEAAPPKPPKPPDALAGAFAGAPKPPAAFLGAGPVDSTHHIEHTTRNAKLTFHVEVAQAANLGEESVERRVHVLVRHEHHLITNISTQHQQGVRQISGQRFR